MNSVVTKEEFWLGIAIITFCVGFLNLIEPLPTETTIYVSIREVINCNTSEEGVVECE